MENHRLLYVDDDAEGRATTAEYLRTHGFQVELAATAAEALSKLDKSETPFASIIVDFHLNDGTTSGADLTRLVLEKDPEAYVIVYSSDPTQVAATESWSAGAVGYVKKEPGDVLLKRVREQCAKFDEIRATLSESQVKSSFTPRIAKIGMVGRSADLAQVADYVELYRDSPETVIIYGESGAGKEKVARALGDPKKPFLAVNCATFKNHDLLEAELFGYERGAFTGADKQKLGILQLAGNGTVFLDEIHEMSLEAQSKLLRAIQEKNCRRMNGTVDLPFHCRLIAASKPNLPELAQSGAFKLDFYYRICKLPIYISALRDRRDDVAPLILHFVKHYALRDGQSMNKIFRSRTVRIMEQYDWPGNIRELDNVVYRLLKHCKGRYVEHSQLPPEFFKKNPSTQMSWETFQENQFQERRNFILKVCENSTHKAHAARQLNILPHAIHALLKTYKITWPKKSLEEESETVVLR